MTVEERLQRIEENRKQTIQQLQEAQGRVSDLSQLVQQQSGAIAALQAVLADTRAESNGHVEMALEEQEA